jgi:glutathione S-transferase
MVYLDRKYPYPPLFGRTAEEAGLIWRAISECEFYLAISGDKVVRPILFGKDLDKLDEIRQAMITVHQEFKTLDERLARSTWLVGDQMTAADISVYPLIQLLLRAASKPAAQALDLGLLPLARSYPNIARWAREIEAFPGYERTYPPHWR